MLSTERIPAEVMVVEGWVPDFVIAAAVNEFASHNCRQAFVTGGPARGMGGYTNDYCNTSASVGAVKLRAAGLSAAMVQMVPSRVMSRNRTYTAAVAVREWTRLLFQKALAMN